MSITIIEFLEYLKKHIKMILIVVVICSILSQYFLYKGQTYTASVVIKYTFEEAKEGKNPKGEKLDAYEIISPIVIEGAISSLNLNTSVEKIRNSITISPFIDEVTREKQKALTEKGEDFVYNPTEFTIKFVYPGSWGSEYGKIFLNKLLESYDDYFMQTYTGQRKIQNIFSNLDYSNYDYMEICELFDGQLSEIVNTLNSLKNQEPNFRSPKTGLRFSDLAFYFSNLWSTDYSKLYANVRVGKLSKNKEMLIKKYQYKIENLSLTSQKKQEEATTSNKILYEFYNEYKEGKKESASQPIKESADKIISSSEMPDNILTTYDEIMLKYVDSAVEAANYRDDVEYYRQIVQSYLNDTMTPEEKQPYIEKAESYIKKIDADMRSYIEIANQTLNDYNMQKGAQFLTFVSPVESWASLSKKSVLAFAIAAGLALGVFLAVLIEIFKKLKEEADKKNRIERISLIGQGVIPVDTKKLLPIERKLFEEAVSGFSNLELNFQPIVDKDYKIVGAEVLTRWNDPELGVIMPDEFLPIAEKYDIMAALGEWILRRACLQIRKWNSEENPNFWASVNFSICQISGPMFMDGIFKAVTETKVNPNNVVIEVSRCGDLDDMDEISKKLEAIKTLGVKVSLDNFGDESATVDTLSKLPIDIFKISKDIISTLDRNINSMKFVQNMVTNAQLLGFKVCAEGVEQSFQADKLVDMGIDYLQGYYYSRPLSAAGFMELYNQINI